MIEICIIASTCGLLLTARDPLEKKKEEGENFVILTNMAYRRNW